MPIGHRGAAAHSPPLPIEGSVDLEMPVERLWEIFLDVRSWPAWNPCFWHSHFRFVCRESLAGARALSKRMDMVVQP